MKIMKRMLTLTVLLAILLCGCNGGEEPNSTPATQPSTQATTPSITLPTETTAPPDGKATYTVTILDQNGNPVSGVAIQFCDPVNCKLPVTTDGNGVVAQKYTVSDYHITLVELPAGYTSEETVFYFENSFELTIVIVAE